MTFPEYLATQTIRKDDVGKLALLVTEHADLLPISKTGYVTRKDLKFALSTLQELALFDAVDQAYNDWEAARQAEADAERLQADVEAVAAKSKAEQETAAAQAKAAAERAARIVPDARVAKLKAQAEADRKRLEAIQAERAVADADAAKQVADAEQEAEEAHEALEQAEGKPKRKGRKPKAVTA